MSSSLFNSCTARETALAAKKLKIHIYIYIYIYLHLNQKISNYINELDTNFFLRASISIELLPSRITRLSFHSNDSKKFSSSQINETQDTPVCSSKLNEDNEGLTH